MRNAYIGSPLLALLYKPVLANAYPPTLVTLLGIVIEVNFVQPENALLPMLVTLLGITVVLQPAISVLVAVSIMQFAPFPELYFVFPSATTIEVKPVQPENALLPMLVTLLGIVIEVKPVQP